MRPPQPAGCVSCALAQKKRLHPKMEPKDRAEAKSKWWRMDEGGGYAIRRLGISRGRRIRRQPGCRRTEPREEEKVPSTSTGVYMPAARPPGNAPKGMTAMHQAQGRSGVLTDHAGVTRLRMRKRNGPALGGAAPVKRRRREGGETPPLVDCTCRVLPPPFKSRLPCAGRGAQLSRNSPIRSVRISLSAKRTLSIRQTLRPASLVTSCRYSQSRKFASG